MLLDEIYRAFFGLGPSTSLSQRPVVGTSRLELIQVLKPGVDAQSTSHMKTVTFLIARVSCGTLQQKKVVK